MKYLMVLPVEGYPLPQGGVAIESAFADHLRMLLADFKPYGVRCLHLLLPSMPSAHYAVNQYHLGVIGPDESIHVTFLPPSDTSRVQFLRQWPVTYRLIEHAVNDADVLHSGVSENIWKPVEFVACWLAKRLAKPTVFFVDIDQRQSSAMSYINGQLSAKSYWLCRWVYDPLYVAQIKWAAKHCALSCLKGQSLVDDFGGGRPQVKNFYDTAHSAEHIMAPAGLENKLNQLRDTETLNAVYFGRLVAYKGIDHMIRAVVKANQHGNRQRAVCLTIIGEGEQRQALQSLIDELAAREWVRLVGAVPYGSELFELLDAQHVLLAAPLSQDTPRSVFDAMCRAVPVLAYDTEYYSSLVAEGGAQVVRWNDWQALSRRLVELARDPAQLRPFMEQAFGFATHNTQPSWLQKRLQWMEGFVFSKVDMALGIPSVEADASFADVSELEKQSAKSEIKEPSEVV